jgi:hypothetical protein
LDPCLTEIGRKAPLQTTQVILKYNRGASVMRIAALLFLYTAAISVGSGQAVQEKSVSPDLLTAFSITD